MHPGAMARTRRLDNYSGWVEMPQNLSPNEGTLLEDFETNADWTVSGGTGGPPTLTEDATVYKVGSKSQRFQANGATGNIDIYKTVSIDMSGYGKYFELWVKNNDSNPFQPALFLSATWPTKYFQYNFISPQIDTSGDWQVLRWRRVEDIAGSAGGMTWADTVTRITFRFNGATRDLNLDGFYHSVEAIGAVLYCFDDCEEATYYNGPAALNIHNAPGTIAFISNNIGSAGYFTAAQLNAIIDYNKWDVINHSETHTNFNTLSQADIETELQDCVTDLESAGVTAHKADLYAASPFNSYDADIKAAYDAQGFRYARTTRANTAARTPANFMRAINHNGILIHSEGDTTVANMRTTIENYAAKQAIIPWYHHEITREVISGSDISVSMLAHAAMWAARAGMYAITYDELYNISQGPTMIRRPKRKYTTW